MHLLLELLDGSLGELGPGLGLLQPGGQGLDLLLVGLLALVGLLLGHLDNLCTNIKCVCVCLLLEV